MGSMFIKLQKGSPTRDLNRLRAGVLGDTIHIYIYSCDAPAQHRSRGSFFYVSAAASHFLLIEPYPASGITCRWSISPHHTSHV